MKCQNCINTVYMDDLGGGFHRCPVCGDEYDETYQPDFDIPVIVDDAYDGLRLCRICGDRETLDEVCHVCRQQQLIDRGDL